jgi:galactokinase/N-acetylgalactosamine kinase
MEAAIAKQTISIYTALSDVFGSLEASLPHSKRWNSLAEEFVKRFEKPPAYIVRAPGRVK